MKKKSIPFIDFSELKISRPDLLGVGGSGKVYKGFFLSTPVAIKQYLNLNLFEGKQSEDDACFSFLNEISNVLALNFPKFNRCHGVSLNDQGDLFIVHDLAASSLGKKLKTGSLTNIQQKHDIAEQILQIMLTLNKLKAIHRNLKPENFLLNSLGEVHICDFGPIRIIRNAISDQTLSYNYNFTVKYAPPEFIVQEDCEMGEVGLYSDIWSLGVILFEIYYEKPFWGKMTNNCIINQIYTKAVPKAQDSSDVPPEITYIVNRALVIDGKMRITLHEILELFEKAKKK